MKRIKKIRVWWRAVMLDYPFWRVTYKNGERTYPLYVAEARGLRDVHNAKMWIDYEYGLNWPS